MRGLRFIPRGDNDYDVRAGFIVIELSHDGEAWTFWNVRVAEQRLGGTQTLGPGSFTDWLNEQLRAVEKAA